MPIFKCTACKSTPNKAIKYATDRNKAAIITTLNLDDGRSYARQFSETVFVWDKPTGYDTRKYYHAKLSFDIRDNPEYGGKLTPKLAMRIAKRLARELWMKHEVVIAVHIDREHIHVHFIINAVSLETGRMLHINDGEYRKQKDRANTLAEEYGLSTIDWRKATKERRKAEREGSTKYAKTVAEQRISGRGGKSWKSELREIIDAVKEETDNREGFEKLLAERGVTLSRSTTKTISYVFGEHPAVRGNRLGDAYTAEAVLRAIKEKEGKAPKPGLFEQIGNAEGKRKARDDKATRQIRDGAER